MSMFNSVARWFGWSAYDAVRVDRDRADVQFSSVQGDEEKNLSITERDTLVLKLNEMYRNSELVRGICNRFSDYVVHTGIRPQAQTTSREWNDEAEAFFLEWCKICDFRQRPGFDMFRLQWIAELDDKLKGESGYVLLANGQLQPIDMERVRTPSKKAEDPLVTQGLQFAANGILTGYYICGRNQNGTVDPEKYEFVRRENFIHLLSPWRIEQCRGIPELAPIVRKIGNISDTDKNISRKVKNESMQFLKIKREQASSFANEMPRNTTKRTDTAGASTIVDRHEWGQVWKLGKDEDVSSFDGTTPHAQYIPFQEWEIKLIASAVGLPWEFILMVFTDGSYSAQRSALLHALHKFVGRHSHLSRHMMQRIWNWRIAKAIKEGAISKAPLDARGISQWYKVDWSLPNMGWVDPESSVKADAASWRLGTKSMKGIVGGYGGDRDTVFAEKAADIQAAMDAATALNAQNQNAGVTWRDIVGGTDSPQNPVADVQDQTEDKSK